MGMLLKIGKKKTEEIPQSSMADVAFLLLIFFIATTIFNKEQGITLSLPGKSTAKSNVNPKNIMKVTSDAAGNVFADEQPIALHQLAQEIRERTAENDKLIISIESHAESRYEVMVQILDEVKAAKAQRISLKMRLI